MAENSSKKTIAMNPTLLTHQILISLATGPLLLALVGGKVLSEVAHDIGQFSEELFRGDRLPLLPIPTPASTSDPTQEH